MYQKPKWLYRKLQTSTSDSDKPEDLATEPPKPPFYLRSSFLALAITIFLGSLIATIINGVARERLCHNHISYLSTLTYPNAEVSEVNIPYYQHTCGNSSASALKNGCVFDRLTVSWQHPSCSQAATSDFLQYAGDRPYQYWLDREGTQLLSEEELAHMNENSYWTTKREHLAHCAFVILRFYKAMDAGERVDSLTGSTKHAHHCMKNFLGLLEQSEDWYEIRTTGNIQYLSC
ncbi:hypothetical protein F5884DRAFT_849201 [Xylogone sp. PMI_703]|nr:hypothetical protein F5884DRAFT_849201 [Xylogone sp. PMI_703]